MPDIEAIHPRADRLGAYAQGRLDEPEMDEIEQHLSSCESCCRTVRDQPEDSLVAKLRGRSAATIAATLSEESAVEPPSGFQVPSSFVMSPGAKTARDEQTTGAVQPPDPDPRILAGLPRELIDHPRYRVVAALGAGGMGTVYRAEHRLMDRPVALKVIRGDLLGNQAMVERFRREVKAAARLASHPNIVAAYDAEQAGETHMLVMEFIEGTDLARVVDRRGPLPVGEACEYARQAALGLAHAFEDGMVHRDIKPQNLMRTTRRQIKILDFGLARFASEVATHAGVTAEGMILGSADYIAPEQIDDPHAADIRADLYSLGCTLYFLLAGRPPFPDGSLIQKLKAHGEKTPRPLREIRADVPPELAQIIERMIAKDPARRLQTPDDVARALAPFADAQAARAAAMGLDATTLADTPALPAASRSLASTVGDQKPSGQATRPGPRLRRPWLRIVAALALLPITAGFLALVTYRIQTETGELVIESEDSSIEVIVKQGGEQVTIVDPKTKKRIELKAGSYELQLAGGGEGLKLSTDSFALKRGGKTVVTVRREPRAPAPALKPASDLLAGADTEEVGEIARFPGPHDWLGRAFFLPDGRRILYTTAGDFQNDQWIPGTDPTLWLGDLADPKNPRKFAGFPMTSWIDLALSRDGRLALTTSADKTLRLWDVETGKSRRVRRQETGVGPVAFSPDERHAAYASGDTIRLCDLKTGDELRTYRGHTGSIRTFAFCGDGRRLVSGGVDDHTIRVWNVDTGEEIRQMRHGDGVTSVTVFPDNRRVLTASWDRTIGIWDLESGRQLRRIVGVANRFGAALAISPDGRRALFGRDHAVLLWDLETNEEIERFEGHTDGLLHVAFSPDGRRALSTALDKTVRVWALPPARPPGEDPPIVEVAQFLGHDGRIESNLAISQDGRRLLSGSSDQTMILWNWETAQPIRRFRGHSADVLAVAFSPDGRRALSGGADKVVRLWDLESSETIHEFHGHTEWVLSVAFSPDGHLAYSTSGGFHDRGSRDGTDSAIRVCDLETGTEVRKLEGHKGAVFSVAISPDGRRVISGGDDQSPILWNAETGAEVRRFRGHTDRVLSVAFLPNGRRALSSSEDRTIRLWDVETGQEIHRFQGHRTRAIRAAVSPDGHRLLSGDWLEHELRLWDLDARKMLRRVNWGNVSPTFGSFAPDSRHAVWGGTDGVIRMYRLAAPDQAKTDQPASPAPPASAKP